MRLTCRTRRVPILTNRKDSRGPSGILVQHVFVHSRVSRLAAAAASVALSANSSGYAFGLPRFLSFVERSRRNSGDAQATIGTQDRPQAATSSVAPTRHARRSSRQPAPPGERRHGGGADEFVSQSMRPSSDASTR